MKFLVVASSFLCLVGATLMASGEPLDHIHWELYKKSFGKVYADAGEEALRRSLFLETKRKVEHHNGELAAELGFELGYSHLSDWSQEELNQLLGSQKVEVSPLQQLRHEPQQEEEELPQFMRKIMDVNVEDLPDEVDWRKVPNRVGPVRDQGHCHGAFAFATTGMLEGQLAKANKLTADGKFVQLSVQNLLDCSPTNGGCFGGRPWYALVDIASQQQGVEADQDYPFVDSNIGPHDQTRHSCAFNKSKSLINAITPHALSPEEINLQRFVAEFGPVSAQMVGTQKLVHYKSGVLSDPACNDTSLEMNHSVLVVGYGTDPKLGDFWIVKNSWGADWGEQGYFRLARNAHNMCGIAFYGTIADLG